MVESAALLAGTLCRTAGVTALELAGWTAAAGGLSAPRGDHMNAVHGTVALAMVVMPAGIAQVVMESRVPDRPLCFLVRVLGHAPRSLRRRIVVTPPSTWWTWSSLLLADAVC